VSKRIQDAGAGTRHESDRAPFTPLCVRRSDRDGNSGRFPPPVPTGVILAPTAPQVLLDLGDKHTREIRVAPTLSV